MAQMLDKASAQDATQNEQEDRLLTPEEVAAQLRVTLPTVYAWLKMGRLRGLRAGKFWRIRPVDLEAFLNPSPEEIERGNATLRRYSREEILQFLAEDQIAPDSIPDMTAARTGAFLQHLQSLRSGNREEQERTWEQLAEVLQADRRP